MKKNIALLMALVLCLSLLAACGKSPAAESGEPSQSADVSETVSPSPELSDSPSELPSGDQPVPSDSPEPEPSADPSQEPSESAGPAIALSHTDVTLKAAGASFVLTAEETGVPEGTRTALVWSSGDESVAAVTDNGDGTATVTAVGPGKAVITASAIYSTFVPDDPLVLSCIVRCRWTEETPAPSESAAPSQQPAGVDLSAFAADIISEYELPAFLSLADDELTANCYAGLEAIAANQKLVYLNLMSMNMGELVLVEVENSDDVAAVKDILQARIDYMVGDGNGPGGAWYPAPIEEWSNNSRVVSSGNYVMMVVDDDCDAIVSEFDALF